MALLGYIFETKFAKDPPEVYFRKMMTKNLFKAFKYFLDNPELEPGHEPCTLHKDSPEEVQLAHVLLSADHRFKSNIIRKMDTSLGKGTILLTAPSSLPSIHFYGMNYDHL